MELKTQARVTGASALAGATALAYAYYEAQSFTVSHETLPVLNPGSTPIRILHLTDIHLMPRQTKKIDWVRSLAQLEPDFVMNTGDNFAHRDALPGLTRALEPLLAFPGAFVMGSNDYHAPRFKSPTRYLMKDSRQHHLPTPDSLPVEEFARHMTGRGWLDLSNVRTHADINGNRIDFVGVDDPHIDRDVFPGPAAPSSEHAVRIGVTHAPYVRTLDQMHQDGCAAIIAGHTHGGQLCIPGFGALVTNCDLDRSRASGLHGWPGPRPDHAHGEDSTWMFVGKGIGTGPFTPFRVACRPEAVMLTLTART